MIIGYTLISLIVAVQVCIYIIMCTHATKTHLQATTTWTHTYTHTHTHAHTHNYIYAPTHPHKHTHTTIRICYLSLSIFYHHFAKGWHALIHAGVCIKCDSDGQSGLWNKCVVLTRSDKLASGYVCWIPLSYMHSKTRKHLHFVQSCVL